MSTWTGRPHLSIFGGKEEDRFTRYLCELLRAPGVLAAFLREICGVEVGPHDSVSAQTQVTVPGGRADLALRGESVYFLFEAKVGAWLHEDQLTPYAREVDQWRQAHPTGAALLFLLAPQRHASGIAQSAQRELSEAGLGHLQPVIVTWEQVATLFQRLEAQGDDPRLSLHLGEFAEIVFYRLGEPLRPFTLEECRLLEDPLAANAIRSARLLVDRATQVLSRRGFSFTASRGFLYEGYGAKYGGRTWWYGVWIDAWAKVGFSPIFLQLLGFTNRPVPPTPQGLPGPVSVQFGNAEHVIPLAIRDGVELEVLALEHADIIWRYATQLPESGAG